MPITYPTAVKTARMIATRDAFDGGGGPGYIEIGTVGMAVVLATVPLALVSGSVSGPVLTLDMPQTDNNAAGGASPAAEARIRNSLGVDVATGLTVGLITDDPQPAVILDNLSIAPGQTVTISSATITHAP